MVTYKKTNWLDTLRDSDGEIIQRGTPLNAQAMTKIEDGIVQTEQKIDTEIQKFSTQLEQKASKTQLGRVKVGNNMYITSDGILDTDSSMINTIDRTNIDADSPPSAFPVGISEFMETRTTQARSWRLSMGLPFFGTGFRLIIITYYPASISGTSTFGIAYQKVIYTTSAGDSLGKIEGVYHRSSVYTRKSDGSYSYTWGSFDKQMSFDGGVMTGPVIGQSNDLYSTGQFRNIIFSKTEPTVDMLKNGEICFVYEE